MVYRLCPRIAKNKAGIDELVIFLIANQSKNDVINLLKLISTREINKYSSPQSLSTILIAKYVLRYELQ